jgi:hypothetical protein
MVDRKGEIQSTVLCEQFPQVECFIRCYTYYRSLGGILSQPIEDSDFWEEVSAALLGSATLAWCNVFGSCRSDLHWSKIIKNMPKKVKEDFINRICKSTCLKEESYKKLRDYIKKMRDKYFAHRDLNWQKHIWNSPDFENALKIVKVYECWVNDLLQKENSPSMNSLTDIIKSAEGEVKGCMSYL